MYLLVPLALRPKILLGGLRIGLEEADGAADNERWPSEIPLANDKLLLSSCLPVSKGRICNNGVCWNVAAEAVKADVKDADKLPVAEVKGPLQLLLIAAAGVEHAATDEVDAADDDVVKAKGVDDEDEEVIEIVFVEGFVEVVLAAVVADVVKHWATELPFKASMFYRFCFIYFFEKTSTQHKI